MADDAKAILRRGLAEAGADKMMVVGTNHLREVLRELGELRQVTQEQAKAIRHTLKGAADHERNLGRVFANVAAMTAHRRSMALEKAITEARAKLFDIETFELAAGGAMATSRGETRFASAADLQAHLTRIDGILARVMTDA